MVINSDGIGVGPIFFIDLYTCKYYTLEYINISRCFMFVGRQKELELLEKLYASDRFEFLVLYGRRRIGKTTLLREFEKKHRCIFFSGMQKNDSMNLSDFSSVVQFYFDSRFIAPFSGWKEAFSYIGDKTQETGERVVLLIDEFPFIAEENPTVKSILQHEIDRSWLNKNIMLVLCGSNISFMENQVMGEHSPLYGRSTSQLEVKKFNYLDSSVFFPSYTERDKLISYGILGGVPRYLKEFDSRLSVKDNICENILSLGAFLKEEPVSLLKMELREPNVYNSILQAIAGGVNRISEIASAIHEDATKVNKYITTLSNLRLLKKEVPCGEKEGSKKGIWRIIDNFLLFWYRFEFANRNYYNLIGSEKAASEIWDSINDYMGLIFEDIAKEYLVTEAQNGRLPFIPYYLGKWWGNNPAIKAQDDVDILALSKNRDKGIFCECKFTNREFDSKDFDDVLDSIKAFPSVKEYWIYIFTSSGCTEEVIERAKEYNTVFIGLKEIFQDSTVHEE